jgi:S1-C subfamily serine protease
MNDLESQATTAQLGAASATTTQEPQPQVAPRQTPPPPANKPPASFRRYWQWYVASLALILAVAAGAIAASQGDDQSAESAAATTVTQPQSATTSGQISQAQSTLLEQPAAAQQLDARAVGEAVIPSVVTVQIRGTAFNGREVQVGSGSGVVYDHQGHVITNNHVASAGSSYEVVLSDGRVYPADVVGTDPTTDLAVLQITAESLHPISIGSSDDLVVGDPAVAVGSPLGLDGGPSLTVGVISAFGRSVDTSASTTLYGMLQTDAPIISGSSGGALVNQDGALVGITTAVGVSPVGAEGIGFATPVELVTRVADEIIADGSASSPYLGVEIAPAMEDTIDGGSSPIGVELGNVVSGMAADQAGLHIGDVISAINGVEVRTNSDLVGQLRRYASGDIIRMTLDNGTTVNVTLGQRPDNL